MYGDVTSNRVGVLFHKLTALEGDIELEGVLAQNGKNIGDQIDPGYMARETNGINEAFGQVLPLKVEGAIYYVVLLKEDVLGVVNNVIRFYSYEDNDLVPMILNKEGEGDFLELSPTTGHDFDHITALGSLNEACFVGCGAASKVVCPKEGGGFLE